MKTTKLEHWCHASHAAVSKLIAAGQSVYYGHDRAPYTIIVSPADLLALGISVVYLPGHGRIDSAPDRIFMRLVEETPLPFEANTCYRGSVERYGGTPDAYWASREETEATYRALGFPAGGIPTGGGNERRPVVLG